MHMLIAEDNPTTQKLLESLLTKMGHQVTVVSDGEAAWNQLQRQSADTPRLALLDWMMPRMHGPDLCRRIRSAEHLIVQPYLILVTSRDGRDDLAAGLRAGADDYLAKPFEHTDLQARVRAGVRVMEAQEQILYLKSRLEELEKEVVKLRQLLPICASCQKIRENRDYWRSVQTHLGAIPGAKFTHGLCPDCQTALQPELERRAAAATAAAAEGGDLPKHAADEAES
jgi:DNA-binding response OmpR family regulator